VGILSVVAEEGVDDCVYWCPWAWVGVLIGYV